MSIQVYWEDDEKTILRYDFEGDWTWDELYTVFNQGVDMASAVDHRVDAIADMRHSGRIPGHAISHLRTIADRQTQNVNLRIIVTTNTFILTIYRTGAKVYRQIPRYFQVVGTIEEAHKIIAEDRSPESQ